MDEKHGLRCVAVSPGDAATEMYVTKLLVSWQPRPLDPREIDYHTLSHSNSSQLCRVETFYADRNGRMMTYVQWMESRGLEL